MRANNALAIVFTNSGDKLLPELTSVRALASLPFGARYRIIDFHLSNLVNAGISKVGIIPKANYRSLMDHIGSGKAWDLDRKNGGLSFLPPFIDGKELGVYKGHVDAINNIYSYIEKSTQDYVIICDAYSVLNIDIESLLDYHESKGADITVAYKNCAFMKGTTEYTQIAVDKSGKINEVLIKEDASKKDNYAVGIYVFTKSKLLEYVRTATERGNYNIGRGILQGIKGINAYGYRIESFVEIINDLSSYTRANFALLDKNIRADLFNIDRPVYTKTRDDMPTKYGLNSSVKNSIIGEGCVIDGIVENSVLFRGVKVKMGAVIKNSIIMQDSIIEENANLQYVITDKEVTVVANNKVSGTKDCTFVFKKGVTA